MRRYNHILNLFGAVTIDLVKDTHREKALSSETLALTESTTMGIWFVGTFNQLLIRGS